MRCASAIEAKSFPLLVHNLVKSQHDDCVLTMCQAVGIPYTTLWRWERGLTQQYEYGLVERLAAFYGLPVARLDAMIHADAARRNRGQRVPIPDLSYRKRGPVPTAQKLARRAGRAVAREPVTAPRRVRRIRGRSRRQPSTHAR